MDWMWGVVRYRINAVNRYARLALRCRLWRLAKHLTSTYTLAILQRQAAQSGLGNAQADDPGLLNFAATLLLTRFSPSRLLCRWRLRTELRVGWDCMPQPECVRRWALCVVF